MIGNQPRKIHFFTTYNSIPPDKVFSVFFFFFLFFFCKIDIFLISLETCCGYSLEVPE